MNHRILNLGAGTQSSMLLLMSEIGEADPVDLAIFADTQAEPDEVYRHLNWLMERVRTPIIRVTAGNLERNGIEIRCRFFSEDENGKRYASIPLFVLNPDGSQGIIRRQCTSEYKIKPITRYIRTHILKLEKGQTYRRGGDTITQVFGISFDERQRAKDGRYDPKWMLREYPLVDKKMTRQMVIAKAEKWFPDHTFPRSACLFCPYKSNAEWRRLRDDHPDDWKRAVKFDNAIRVVDREGIAAGKRLVGVPFVHRQLVPLDKADLRSEDERNGQATMFGMANECEGMCGV